MFQNKRDGEENFEKQFIAGNTYPNNSMLFNFFSEQFIAYLVLTKIISFLSLFFIYSHNPFRKMI